MITYQSNQYSVPAEYISKSLLLESDNEALYIYDSIKLVVIHPIRSDKKLNYHPMKFLFLTHSSKFSSKNFLAMLYFYCIRVTLF